MSEKPITQRIKDRLAAYTAMLRDIDNQLERLDRMEMTMASPPGPDLTGMPRGSGTPSDRTGMMVERKMELEEQIDRLKAEEKQERNAIEGLILQLSDPDERAVIRLRYFDRADWESTCGVLFGDRRGLRRQSGRLPEQDIQDPRPRPAQPRRRAGRAGAPA